MKLLLLGLLVAFPSKDVRRRTLDEPYGPAVEERGQIQLTMDGAPVWKRFVLRHPQDEEHWNGKLVIGAHGGRGGENFSRDGKVIGTDEVSLDDVIGEHALSLGFAYASVDRDGIGGTREGLRLTKEFTNHVAHQLGEAMARRVRETYLVGLSMGGGVARYAAEEESPLYDGVLIVAGANGDTPTRLERSARMAALWPLESEREASAYAEVVGTPVEARRFWPFMGRSRSEQNVRQTLEEYGLTDVSRLDLGTFRVPDPRENEAFWKSVTRENTTGRLTVPTIEVVGTYDDFVRAEILAYREKVENEGLEGKHRLYQVEGAWHISPDDDAISSFQFMGTRMGLSEDAIEAMATGKSYLPRVRESLELLDRWVDDYSPPPASP